MAKWSKPIELIQIIVWIRREPILYHFAPRHEQLQKLILYKSFLLGHCFLIRVRIHVSLLLLLVVLITHDHSVQATRVGLRA